MSVAKSYAKALFSVLRESSGDVEAASAALKAFRVAVEAHRSLRVALTSPLTSSREKAAVAKDLAEKMGMSGPVRAVVITLAEKGRASIVAEIIDEFELAAMEAEGVLRGEVVSAEPLSDEELKDLGAAFGKKLGKTVRMELTVDPDLIAGVKVTVSGITYDGSMRAQLEHLQRTLAIAPAQSVLSH